MTTPDEHRRNLAWTASTLQGVADVAPSGSSLRERALQLLESAPSMNEIEQLDTASPAQVAAAIDSIEAAHELFRSALRELDDPKICRALQVTLRHYPGPPDFALWRLMAANGVPMGGIILRTTGPLGG